MRRLLALTCAVVAACSAGESQELPPVRLSITARALPDATVGQRYREVVTAAGGQAPYAWSVDLLPDGLELGPTNGQLSGTPTRPSAPQEVVIRVTDAAGASVARTFTLRVRPLPLAITSTSVPPTADGADYNVLLRAEGGLPPLTWTFLEGALPDGVTLSPSGVLAGRARGAGTYVLTARVTDAEGTFDQRAFTLVVRALIPMIADTALPRARFGESYEHQLSVRDAQPPVDWSLVSGRLPQGVGLDLNGLIAGRPTEDGPFPFVVRVNDGGGHRDEAMFELYVVSPLAFTTRVLPVVVTDRPYRARIEVQGGVPPYRFTNTRPLPAGITFAADGTLAGTARMVGRYELTVRVEDAVGSAARTATYVLTVSDDYQYETIEGLDFPRTCTATAVAVTDLPIEIADSFAIAALSSVEVEYEYRDLAGQPGFPMGRFRLWLISPKGQLITLCGDNFQVCPNPVSGVPVTWPPVVAQTPFSVVQQTNPRGTWRLRAGIEQPTVSAGGQCQQTGRIVRARLVFDDDRETAPYGFVRGWFPNNLIQRPWLRLWAPNNIGESELDLTLERWAVGPNNIREAGEGDDVRQADTITWSIVSAPAGTTITPDGHLVGGGVTGRGTVRAEDATGATTDVEFLVVPPDWNTQRTN